MKVRSKGKVHPSPSSSSHPPNNDAFSVLKLIPAAILALVSVLSFEDKEVLAYMITINPSSPINGNGNSRKKHNKKSSSSTTAHHKPPAAFDCDCFDCYTSYWVKWDSSPNRELIHQAIEAFEEHLNNGEQSKRNNRAKKRDKLARRQFTDKPPLSPGIFPPEEEPADLPEIEEGFVQVYVNNDVKEEEAEAEADGGLPEDVPLPEMAALVVRATAAIDHHHKGLARKVLPDVLGLFNSRLWNLWSPDV